MDDLEFRRDALDSPVASQLIDELQAEFVVRYGGRDESFIAAADFVPPAGDFLVLYRDGRPVACGGIRRIEASVVELKRMYVVADQRRSGIARRLLAGLERAAADLGTTTIRLETGTAQPEAMALYASSGYQPISNFGYYAGAPLSRSFEKVLPHGSGA
ncbi:MAG: GNAT family N-acetyltransferase [Actinomycetota bacterium]|nr:GNAT family N-acetyltransferase [Actinomycetota bacterium]